MNALDRLNFDNSTPELQAAFVAAQAKIEHAAKSSTNPQFHSKYADLSEVLNSIRPVFAENGLAIIQSTSFDGSLVSVDTAILHRAGGYIVATASCSPAKIDAQGIGAATTYLRRYSAAAMCGIAQEDDDGNSAAHDTPPSPRKAPASPGKAPASTKATQDYAAALDKAQKGSQALASARELIAANNPEGYLKLLLTLNDKQITWIESQLDEEQGEWSAKVLEGHESLAE